MTRHKQRPAGQRQLRVGEELRHALAQVLARGELRDPALSGRLLTVTEVRLSPDLRNARVFVVPLGRGEDDALLAGLERSAPHLRARLAELVRMQFSPRLTFALDTTFDAASHIESVLRAPEVARDLAPRAGEGEDDGT